MTDLADIIVITDRPTERPIRLGHPPWAALIRGGRYELDGQFGSGQRLGVPDELWGRMQPRLPP
jgi:hypothetical protein